MNTVTCVTMVALVVGLQACGGAGRAPLVSGDQTEKTETAEANEDPFAITGSLGREQLPAAAPSYAATKQALPPLPKGVGALPDSCKPFTASKAGDAAACSDASSALTSPA